MEKQKLDIDLEALFPGTALPIGNQLLIIRPLNIEQLSILSKKVSGLGTILEKEKITLENFNKPENLFKLAIIALDNAPDVLEEAANVEIDTLRQLPLDIVVQIVETIISENMKSKEVLEKNFKSLISKFQDQPKVAAPKTLK